MSTKIICNLETGAIQALPLSPAELADLEERKAAAAAVQPDPAPTKEQLMAELAALTAKIQALE